MREHSHPLADCTLRAPGWAPRSASVLRRVSPQASHAPERSRSKWYLGAVVRNLICNLVESLPEESKAKARLSSEMQTKERLGCARGGLWHQIHAHGPADAGVSQFPMDAPSQSTDSPTRSHLVPSRPSVLVLTLFTLHPQPLRLLPLRIWNLFPQHLLPVSFLPGKHCLDFSDQSCRRLPPPMTRLLLPLP